jgi:hypothetical protein
MRRGRSARATADRTVTFINFDDMADAVSVDARDVPHELRRRRRLARGLRTGRSMDRTCNDESILLRVSDSNAARLDRLHGQGVQVVVDGRDVLEFLFERVLATKTVSEFDRSWAFNIDGLLDQVETTAGACDVTTGRSLIKSG